MLRFDPLERFSCADAMKHPYFQDFQMNIRPSLSENIYHRHPSRKYKVSWNITDFIIIKFDFRKEYYLKELFLNFF